MPYSETVSVEVDARNTLIRHRDMIKTKYGVDVYFPRSEVRGAYQGMVMKGTTGDVFKAKQEVSRVLVAWKEEYEAFRARKKERQRLHRETKNVEEVYWPEVGESKAASFPPKKMRNAFSTLLDDEGEAVEVSAANEPAAKVSKEPVLKGWAAIAAKAPVVKAPVVKAPETISESEEGTGHPGELTVGDVMQVNDIDGVWFAWGEASDDECW